MPSLYVHVPFCVQKCDYCAFYSHSLSTSEPKLIPLYLKGLELEMAQKHQDAPEGVSSLFIGGGTPTALKKSDLEGILNLIQRYFPMKEEAERTIEGNPGTLTCEKLELIHNRGINRFSLGVQSFDDRLLSAVGRIHTARQAREAIVNLRRVGFKNLNLDLMFGLPEQTMETWKLSLEEAISYKPEHLSLYGLMLEEGTPLFARYAASQVQRGMEDINTGELRESNIHTERVSVLPDEELQAEMYEWAVKRLKAVGYRQYETSNFALSGYECRHNLGYWRGEEYIGVGPGGVSCLNRVRWKTVEDIPAYEAALCRGENPVEESGREVLSLRECMAERVILGLRLEEGVDLKKFREDFGVNVTDIYGKVLERYGDRKVFLIKDHHLCLNPKYAFVANAVLQEFV